VVYIDEAIIKEIQFTSNVFPKADNRKCNLCGPEAEEQEWLPMISSFPIHFKCDVIWELNATLMSSFSVKE
jgi:hypothetical protein